MKKYVLMLTMVCMVGGLFVGCGKKKEETKEKDKTEAEATEEVVDMPSMEKVDYDKAIKLGKYKGLETTKTITTVTDEMVETEIKNALVQYPAEVGEGEVAGEGDTVNIDFEGKLDGKAFEGGTAAAQDLTLGSGSFIPGFEDQLIGVTKGQTLDINVTFPEEYSQSPDLAGKAVVFTVKVNAIKRAAETVTDEWVAANTEYKTVDEYRAGMKKQLEESYATTADQQVQEEAFMQVLESSEVKDCPKELLEYGEKQYKNSKDQEAKMYNMEMEDYLKGQNMTQEQFDKDAKTQGEEIAKQMLVFAAIADKEGFKESDKEYKKILDEFVTQTGVKTEEELQKNYGKNTIHQNVLIQMVLDFVMAEAKVTEVEATPAPEAQLEQPAEEAPAEEAAE